MSAVQMMGNINNMSIEEIKKFYDNYYTKEICEIVNNNFNETIKNMNKNKKNKNIISTGNDDYYKSNIDDTPTDSVFNNVFNYSSGIFTPF